MRLKFVASAALTSRLIEWFGGGNHWSHVAAMMPSGDLIDARADRVGGKPAGVNVRPDNYEKWPRWRVLELQALGPQNSAWENFLKSQVGLPYDRQAILDFFDGVTPRMRAAWICSGLQTAALQKAGVLPAYLGLNDEQVTPNALEEMCMARGAVVIDQYPKPLAVAL